tara:strand:+ start:7313 stop:10876 length:3564 start_codon:yes stop_codon:yes gene_type:complete
VGQALPVEEICDKADNDCDGQIDDVPAGTSCVCTSLASRRQCYTGDPKLLGKGECASGTQYCEQDFRWGPCRDEGRPSVELCDEKDNDCDGKIDNSEDCRCVAGTKRPCYEGPSKSYGVGACKAGVQTCGTDELWGDCVGDIRPKEEETTDCNGVDDNCDGQIDELCATSCTQKGFQLCDGLCLDTRNNPVHCGACGKVCSSIQQCQEGKCICEDGLLACGDACVDPQKSNDHCGACGKTCTNGLSCQAGICKCPIGQKQCGNTCVDTQISFPHCGACNNACAAGMFCESGECKCPQNQTKCGNACVDTKTTQEHCGMCGKACGQDKICVNGACADCPQNAVLCDGRCIDPNTDPRHCGTSKACGVACTDGEVCKAGSCVCKDGAERFCHPNIDDKSVNVGICRAGVQKCSSGQWGACDGEIKPAQEDCNGKDDDCDGSIDNNLPVLDCPNQKGVCLGAKRQCTSGEWRCNIQDFEQTESLCDGKDNDCDGLVDEALTRPCANQTGVCKGTVQRCQFAAWSTCETTGYQPSETLCDGQDNDCDGLVDEGCTACIPSHEVPPPSSRLNANIRSLAISPDGTSLLAGLERGVVLWEVQKRVPRLSFTGVNVRVLDVAFHPDGKSGAAAGDSTQGITYILNVQTGQTSSLKVPDTTTIASLAYHPDGTLLAVGGSSKKIYIWDLKQRKVIQTLTGHTGTIQTLAFNRQGTLLASGSYDKTIKIWDLSQTTPLVRTLTGHTEAVNTIDFHPDGKRLASGAGYRTATSKDNSVKLWDVTTGTTLATLQKHQNAVLQVQFNFDGSLLASTGKFPYRIMVFWDTRTNTPKAKRVVYADAFDVNAMDWAPDGQTVITGGSGLALHYWSCPQRCNGFGTKPQRQFGQHHSQPIRAMTWSLSSEYLVSVSGSTSSNQGFAKILYEPLSLLSKQYNTQTHSLFSVDFMRLEFTSKGRLLVFGDALGNVHSAFQRDTNLKTFIENKTSGNTDGHSEAINALQFDPLHIFLLTASEDTDVKLWDSLTSATPKLLHTFKHTAAALSLDTDASGDRVAVGYRDGVIKIWKLSDYSLLHTLNSHTGAVHGVQFSPDGSSLASASADKKTIIWDASSGSVQHTFPQATDELRSVAWSPDGKFLAAGGMSSMVYMWEVMTKRNVSSFPYKTSTGSDIIHAVSYSPSGRRFSVGTDKGHLYTWFCQ